MTGCRELSPNQDIYNILHKAQGMSRKKDQKECKHHRAVRHYKMPRPGLTWLFSGSSETGCWREEQGAGSLGSGAVAQASLLRSTASYVWFAGREWDSQQKAIIPQGEVIRKLIKQCCTKGTRDYLKCFTGLALGSLGTDKWSLQWGKGQVPRAPAIDSTLPSLPLSKETKLVFPLTFNRGLQESLGETWPAALGMTQLLHS